MILGEITSENAMWACIICVSILSFIVLFITVRLLIKLDDFKLSMIEYIQSVGNERIATLKRIDKIERKVVRHQQDERKKD